MDTKQTIIANLLRACSDNQTIAIGGGTFDAADILRVIEAQDEAIQAGTKLCENLVSGGEGHMQFVHTFNSKVKLIDA